MARASSPSALSLAALVLAALLAAASAHTDYYESLGLPTDADDAAIKKAYRKLSLKYHPGACRAALAERRERTRRRTRACTCAHFRARTRARLAWRCRGASRARALGSPTRLSTSLARSLACADKNPGDEVARQKQAEISLAYEVLSDPEKRQVYDLEGIEGACLRARVCERVKARICAPARSARMIVPPLTPLLPPSRARTQAWSGTRRAATSRRAPSTCFSAAVAAGAARATTRRWRSR